MDNKEFKDFINKLRRIDDNILVSIELWCDDLHNNNFNYIIFCFKNLSYEIKELFNISVDFNNDKVGLGLLTSNGEFENIIENNFINNPENFNLTNQYLQLINNYYDTIKESFR
jgi:hypothetical protein